MKHILCDVCVTEVPGVIRTVLIGDYTQLMACSSECERVIRRRFAITNEQPTIFLHALPVETESLISFIDSLSFPQRSMLFGELRRSLNGVSMRASVSEYKSDT